MPPPTHSRYTINRSLFRCLTAMQNEGELLEPEVIVLDEATSILDMSVQAQNLNLLKEMRIAHDLTYLQISHAQAVVDWMADFVYTIQDGRLLPTK